MDLYLNSVWTRSGVPWMRRIIWLLLSTSCCPGTSTPVSSWSPSNPAISSPCFPCSPDSGPQSVISGLRFYRFVIMAWFTGYNFFLMREKNWYIWILIPHVNLESTVLNLDSLGEGWGGWVVIRLLSDNYGVFMILL